MTRKLAHLSNLLTAAGIPNLPQPSEDYQLVDDAIAITPLIEVQVGNGYLGLTIEDSDGQFQCFDGITEKTLIPEVRKALRLEANKMTQTKLNTEIVDYCADKRIALPTDVETANAAWDVADACDCTIQAQDMVRLFPGQPEMHTATTFGSLVRLLR